jgi:hypothetical protein
MSEAEVAGIVGMVLVLIGTVLLLGVWPDAPAREMLGIWVIVALSLALWRILVRGDQ